MSNIQTGGGTPSRVIVPTGSNLSNSSRTISPADGSLGYDETTQLVYYGKNQLWFPISGGGGNIPVPPTLSKIVYVTKYGNDASGDGSFETPFLTVSKAITTANALASLANPIVIQINPGVYVENNNAGPLIVTADGVSIIGDSNLAVFISPGNPSIDLLSSTKTIRIRCVTLQSSAPLATGLVLSSGNLTGLSHMRILNFLKGIDCSGATNTYSFNKCTFALNTTAANINNTSVEFDACEIFGKTNIALPPGNNGIVVAGANASVVINGGICGLCQNGLLISNNSRCAVSSVIFRRNTLDITQTTSSKLTLNACDFQLSGCPSSSISSDGAGTIAEIISCSFDGKNILGVGQGNCIDIINDAAVIVSGANIQYYDSAVNIGDPSDVSSTSAIISSTIIQNCITDILQQGSSTLSLTASSISASKILIDNPVNVNMAYFNLEGNNSLQIGSSSDEVTSLIHAEIGGSNHIGFHYRPGLYGAQAIGVGNTSLIPSSLYNYGTDETSVVSITKDRSKVSKLRLISDSSVPIGTNTSLRGWDIQKTGTTSELAFSYQNTDIFGQSIIPQFTVLQLDGVNNKLQLPSTGTEIVFSGDTNLYRSSANVLKTDDNFIVNTLTPGRAIVTNSITNQLSSSIVTSNELNYLSGLTSPIQTQLLDKVTRSGDTMTGTLVLPTGSAIAPALTFSGSTTSGLFETSDNLSITTSGVERLKVGSSGTVAIKQFNTTGVVHNDSFGNLSTSSIVDTDISPLANILDTKLANITTAGKVANSATTANTLNSNNTIVSRDVSGNFAANTITANLVGNVTGASSGNVLKTGDTMAGALTIPAGTAATPSIKFAGSTNTGFSANTPNAISIDTNGIERMKINGTGVTVSNLTSSGIVHTDVTGLLSTSSIVNADITNATITNSKLATVSSSNTSGSIVARDGSGNFSTNQITINGAVLNPTDAATKDYVDSSISSGLVAKTPADVVSTSNIASLSGLQTIDSVSLVATNRVLLTAQTTTTENGLWEVQVGVWTRPLDFSTGTVAGQAYVLITQGSINGGSSWLCNTPTAIIDTNSIIFELFTLPNTTTGANVGSGTGQIFRNKTGNAINFKTLASGPHSVLVNNANDITISTDATDTNTANTIVSRDVSGNFSAGMITAELTGSASLNVLKTGDDISGILNMLNQTEIRFQDASAGEYIGLKAPPVIPTSYSLSLPSTTPLPNQTLKSGGVIGTQLEWTTEGGSITPLVSRLIYVTKYGNDTTGDGSFDTPYASLGKAITTANSLASGTDTVTILISAGTYIEDNSAGPLSITSEGVSIVGDSPSAVIFIPNTPTNDFIVITQTSYIGNATFASAAPMARGIVLTTGVFTVLNNLKLVNFSVGIEVAGSNSSYLCETCIFVANTIGLFVNDTVVECTACTYIGSTSIYGVAANTGMSTTGATSVAAITGGTCALCATGFLIGNNSLTTASAVVFKLNTYDVVQKDASHMSLLSCTFAITTQSTDIDIQISGAGTYAEIIGCQFNGKDIASIPGATAIHLFDSASLDINGGDMKNYTTCIRVGTSTDTSSTQLFATSLGIHNCTIDILQEGMSMLNLNASTASSSKITINDPTNVNLSYFDLDNNDALAIGTGSNTHTDLMQVAIGEVDNPAIDYRPSLYSTRGIGFHNPTSLASSLFSLSNGESNFTSVTTDRTKKSTVNLLSDTNSPAGSTVALRGWTIQKNSTSAELAFMYQNSDIIGQPSIPSFTLAQFDGVNNQFQLPTIATKIVFGGDTNIYRSSANVLKTDDTLIVGTLTAGRSIITDGSNQFASSTTTDTEIGFLTGVTSAVQTQINNKVTKAGDTMTGILQLPAGTTALPSLTFTSSNTTGLSAATSNLSFSTSALERMKIAAGGVVSINNLTLAGVVHNDASGNLSTSLIVNADIAIGANINDSKLANISTAGKVLNSATTATNLNTASAIVSRDSSGNFTAGTITASLNGNASTATSTVNFSGNLIGDVTGTQGATIVSTIGGVTTANVVLAINTVNASTNLNTASTIVKRDAAGNFSAGIITASLNGNATTSTSTANFSGNLSGDVTGTQSSTVVSTVGGVTSTNIATGVNLANAATNLNTASTIVKRDSGGNFTAGTITASLNGNATTSTTSTNFSGNLSGDVTGVQTSTIVSTIGGVTSANIVAGVNLANAATNLNTLSSIVRRDASGNFTAGTITANLVGLASNSTTSISFSGSLAGDVTGTQTSTVVSTIGGISSANIATGVNLANAATNLNTPSTIVKRDGSGNFTAGIITATLNGNATTATSTANFSGSLVGDVTGTQTSTVVSTIGGLSSADIVTGVNLANDATNLNTPSTIVKRDVSGNFTAGTITASLIGTVTGSSSLNVLKSGDTMTGILTHFAGTSASPAIQFSGSSNTGISAPVANKLSFDANGIETMTIDSSTITAIGKSVRTNISADQAIQIVTVTGNNQNVTSLATTSILLIKATASRTGYTIAFPPSPINGQIFTIIYTGVGVTLTVTNTGGTGGATVVNGLASLSSTVTSAMYVYYSTDNIWYCAK